MQARSTGPLAPAASRLNRLAQLPLRFGKLKDEAALHAAIVSETARLLGAHRVLLVLQSDTAAPRIAAPRLGSDESADALLQAVAPRLAEAIGRQGGRGIGAIDRGEKSAVAW